jgi:hypothetical protein
MAASQESSLCSNAAGQLPFDFLAFFVFQCMLIISNIHQKDGAKEYYPLV